ncbi:EF-hand domain-containing protein D2 [Suricata suricatta]|uniref:EF-hand domain-containing protein D2 n=1 Tax=Suricata suricatta TaxID=37032 RepID=UPI00115532D1|nr:EF-hand domain-containing protein D2 [Suricata suricatta]
MAASRAPCQFPKAESQGTAVAQQLYSAKSSMGCAGPGLQQLWPQLDLNGVPAHPIHLHTPAALIENAGVLQRVVSMATDGVSEPQDYDFTACHSAVEKGVDFYGGPNHPPGATAALGSADDELSAKLLRRADLNQGIGEPQSPSRRVFNPYTEFKEFSRKQIKDMEKMFKQHLVPSSPRQFLLIFRKAAAGELQEDSGLHVLARLSEIDVSTEGVKGAKSFFEAKVQAINVSSRFEEEIKAEQEERKKQAEEMKQRKAAFKELQSAFK